MRVALALFLLCAGALAAHADPGPYDLYLAGRYDDAIRAGEAQNDGPGLALAARASLAQATLRDPPCLECLKDAEAIARRAVAADPLLPDPHTDIALAIGLQARITGSVAARLHDDGRRAKTEIDAALAADPGNTRALSALGAWNIEIVRIGGAFLARLTYGATMKDGLALFARAVAAAPGDLVIRYQYALALAGYDADDYRTQIESALAGAGQIAPVSTYDALMRTRAGELLGLLRNGDRAGFSARVRKYQGYPS